MSPGLSLHSHGKASKSGPCHLPSLQSRDVLSPLGRRQQCSSQVVPIPRGLTADSADLLLTRGKSAYPHLLWKIFLCPIPICWVVLSFFFFFNLNSRGLMSCRLLRIPDLPHRDTDSQENHLRSQASGSSHQRSDMKYQAGPGKGNGRWPAF